MTDPDPVPEYGLDEVVLMADPRVEAVPVRECGEPLVELATGPVRLRAAAPGVRTRRGVRSRLVAAAEALPAGLALLVVEGHRGPARQRSLFEAYRASVASERPELDAETLRSLTSRLVAPPGPQAPHVTGAAVDLTLCDDRGLPLDLGTDIDASPSASHGACYTDAEGLGPIASRHREILRRALGGAGLVNYPTEWWHWSYGDRYWALMTGAPAAVYGPSR